MNIIMQAIRKKVRKIAARPYSKFNISWLQEKYYKHATKRKKYRHKYTKDISVVYYNSLEFLHAVKEIFVDEIYLFRTEREAPFIIDCGGFIGLSALFFKVHYPAAKVLVFEPDKENYNIAKENIESWKAVKDITLVNKAVWINNESVDFLSTNNMSSSIVKNNDRNKVSVISVQAQRLKELLNQRVDFLKIDIEGAEYEVMLDIDCQLMNVDNLFVEYHGDYHEMYKLNTILSIIEKNNFKCYIKEADNIYAKPFYDRARHAQYDVQLNIFAFKK